MVTVELPQYSLSTLCSCLLSRSSRSRSRRGHRGGRGHGDHGDRGHDGRGRSRHDGRDGHDRGRNSRHHVHLRTLSVLLMWAPVQTMQVLHLLLLEPVRLFCWMLLVTSNETDERMILKFWDKVVGNVVILY